MFQERLDRPAITTDIIVGFPGETEAEFAETLAVCREVGFSKIHIFPFSARRGTPAWSMAEQISPELKAERVERLAAVEAELRDAYFAKLLGRPLDVLVETPLGGERYVGTSCRYAPVELDAAQSEVGQFVSVVGNDVRGGRILAGTRAPLPRRG